MYHDFLANSRLMVLPLIGLFLCFFAFVGIVVRLYVGMRHGESMDHIASLPLEDDREAERSAESRRGSVL